MVIVYDNPEDLIIVHCNWVRHLKRSTLAKTTADEAVVTGCSCAYCPGEFLQLGKYLYLLRSQQHRYSYRHSYENPDQGYDRGDGQRQDRNHLHSPSKKRDSRA